MSDNEYNDDYEDYDNTGGGLRAQLEKVLKENRTLKSENATFKSEVATQLASKALTQKGYPPAVARLAVSDGVDVSDEKALDKWLADNGDLFVRPAPQPVEGEQPEATAEQQQQPIPDGVESTFGAINRIHATSQPGLTNKYDTATAALSKDATPEEVLAAYRAAGL